MKQKPILIVVIIVILITGAGFFIYKNNKNNKNFLLEKDTEEKRILSEVLPEKIEGTSIKNQEEDNKITNNKLNLSESEFKKSNKQSQEDSQINQKDYNNNQQNNKELTEIKTKTHQRLEISFFKGIWTQPGGEEKVLNSDIKKMLEDGVNIFAISVLYHTNPDGTVKIVSLGPQWEYNSEVGYLNLIKTAHNGGLGVYLELDFDHWWEDQQFSNLSEKIKDNFIKSVKTAIIHWAEIAEKEKVELFSPINEPTNVLGKKEGIKLVENILPEIKKKFKGKTNVKLFGIEIGDFSPYGTISGYDYASVNVYAIDTSNKEFISYIQNNVIPYMKNLVQKYELKGYLFGEIGIPADNKEQAKLFEQFFNLTWDDTKGYFISAWGPKFDLNDPFPDMEFTNSPAEEVIKKWYKNY